jgi:hypothetical protein
MQRELTAYSSPWRMGLILLGAFVFVVLGFWMVGLFGEVPESRRWPAGIAQLVGWASIIFFGFCAVVGIPRMFDKDAQLRISPDGILFKPWSKTTIPWQEIHDVSIWQHRRQKAIVLHLGHPEQYPSSSFLGKLAGMNRALTGGDISISLTGLDKSFDEALTTIHGFRNAR